MCQDGKHETEVLSARRALARERYPESPVARAGLGATCDIRYNGGRVTVQLG